MSRRQIVQAIVLQTHDVGEADRFCILFTRERGRLAARARSVRRLKSHMGGSLLPFGMLKAELTEMHGGYLVTGAQQLGEPVSMHELPAFLEATQAMELLLHLLHDEEPITEAFDLTREFLLACALGQQAIILPYTLRLLRILGHLPDANDPVFSHFPEQERAMIRACAHGQWREPHVISEAAARSLSAFCKSIVTEQSSRNLKADGVARDMR